MTTPTKTGYAPVNGLELYYEIHGTGKPLILLHGGIAALELFESSLPVFAGSRQVILVHLQAHGRTKDIDRPLRFEFMADDIAALLAHLGIAKADVMGYSLGGGVAMQLAIRHPEVVDRLVVVSEAMKRSGYYPEVIAAFDQMEAMAPQIGANVAQSPLAELYPDVDWVQLFAKMGDLLKRDYDWSEEFAAISSPTMLVFADADAQTPEYIMEAWRLLGGGQRDAGLDGSLRPQAQLAIVPGTTHYNLVATPVVAELVAPFLDAERPQSGSAN
ncbi:alpha/beta fold hydrolase [Chelativorans intermedius]|uniref:Alpha/beta fold hydrolase n=1 Tax=Chelativorans intermedius TaxID=515947 RepID=A0ABV6D2E3_9HYPH|nr:alpha/beta hydrolase [Chelativorans intermedius]MCT8997373.1 alpha/beta hydrolase [Chelativorans intermedius]